MRRIRLLIEANFHPEVGSRRLGEVFELSDVLGTHWVNQGIAEFADGEAISEPRAVAPNPEEPWDVPVLEDDAMGGTRVNGDDRPAPRANGLGVRRQRRNR